MGIWLKPLKIKALVLALIFSRNFNQNPQTKNREAKNQRIKQKLEFKQTLSIQNSCNEEKDNLSTLMWQ